MKGGVDARRREGVRWPAARRDGWLRAGLALVGLPGASVVDPQAWWSRLTSMGTLFGLGFKVT